MAENQQLNLATSAPEEFAAQYIDHLITVLKRVDCDAISQVIQLFINARSNGRTIYFLGNGGSAATAAHFANDLSVCASPEGSIPFRSLCLASNTAFITCLANDTGYENIFSSQLRNLVEPGDIVVGISASGNSPNAVKALQYAEQRGAIPVAIVGFDGGIMKRIARHSIHIETEKGEYGPVEDARMALDHLISTYISSLRS
jgi:D-sedoheptulose 7-phosphate isomerase